MMSRNVGDLTNFVIFQMECFQNKLQRHNYQGDNPAL